MMADSPSAYRRPKRRRVAKTAYDPFDEDARPQVRIQKLTQDVLKKQVRELAARVGPSQWSRMTLREVWAAIAAHMRLHAPSNSPLTTSN